MYMLSGERNTALGTMAGRFLADGVTNKTAGDDNALELMQARALDERKAVASRQRRCFCLSCHAAILRFWPDACVALSWTLAHDDFRSPSSFAGHERKPRAVVDA